MTDGGFCVTIFEEFGVAPEAVQTYAIWPGFDARRRVPDGRVPVGTVALDVSAEGASDALAFEAGGTYDVSGLRLTVADPAKLDKAKRYVVLGTNGATLSSEPDVSALPKNWELRFRDNIGQIVYRHGLTILLQ